MSVTTRVPSGEASPEEIGRRIRQARLAAGMSQRDLAGTEMSDASLSRFEAGARRPRPPLLAAIARRLGLTVEELTALEAPSDVRLALQVDIEQAELALACGDVETAVRLAEAGLARGPGRHQGPPGPSEADARAGQGGAG